MNVICYNVSCFRGFVYQFLFYFMKLIVMCLVVSFPPLFCANLTNHFLWKGPKLWRQLSLYNHNFMWCTESQKDFSRSEHCERSSCETVDNFFECQKSLEMACLTIIRVTRLLWTIMVQGSRAILASCSTKQLSHEWMGPNDLIWRPWFTCVSLV